MIKNFVYLDEDKMYSLSSQLFEGVTEYVLDESSRGATNAEEQKGPVGSGRVIGDILRSSERRTEKKFLNDYSFTLFEQRLLADDRVTVIASGENEVSSFAGRSFIKITSRATFNDVRSITHTLKNFNTVGQAIAHVTNFDAISELRAAKASGAPRRDIGKNRVGDKKKGGAEITLLAEQSGLQHDQKFLDDLALLLNYGFQDQLEVQLNDLDVIYSASLNRSNLREPEDLLIRKYARRSEVKFTLFGIITQSANSGIEEVETMEDGAGIKRALMNMVSHMSNVEATFVGRLANEVIIDPIALYTEL